MATYDYEDDNSHDLSYNDFSTDKAKDEGYMQSRQTAQKVVETARAKGVELGGTEFFEHKSRRDILGENLTNYTPARFALNSSAA